MRSADPSRRPDRGAVLEALDRRAGDLFRMAFGEPVRAGAADWRAKADGAVSMRMDGRRRGLWYNHRTGECGDLLDLAAVALCGLGGARDDFPRVLSSAAAWAGVPPEAAGPSRAWRTRCAERTDGGRERAALVARLARLARPVAGSPAGRYLAARGIATLPAGGIGYLPPVPRTGVMHAREAALVVWATDGDGRIMGGQRILVDPHGNPADRDVRKPAFGAIRGAPARFPARGGTGGPLAVAEGPESALSVWMATGLETWAVFGVSGWRAAPVPVDRDVILAPDRDAPDSPAGQAFREAVAHHLGRGRRLRIAEAPEPEGSKRDLNDTLRGQGPLSVLAAVTRARPPEGTG